jgi:N-acetylmuramic acid 6-phosphate etherase
MPTEDRSVRFADLDMWPTLEAAEAMLDSQQAAVAAIRPALAVLSSAADLAAARLKDTGRLVYVGAGTSGRIALQDGVELCPTYDWPESRLVFVLAGGPSALTGAVENAEDDEAAACTAMHEAHISSADVVIGVAASGKTPFTVAALATAKAAGALTIGFSNNAGAKLLTETDHGILLDTGAEPVTGSTRMKAGTAQKVALNILSTAIMLRLGRVYQGLMVNMRPTNVKLQARAVRIVQQITNKPEADCNSVLQQCKGNIKLACLMLSGTSMSEAKHLLDEANDNLRLAFAALLSHHHIL